MVRRRPHPVTCAILAGIIFLLCAPGAHAQTVSPGITQSVTGSGLDVTATATTLSFGTVTLTGVDQTVTASAGPTFRVKDASGTNGGWNLTFSSTDFVNGANTIPASGFTFTPSGGTITAANATTQTVDPSNGPREVGGSALALNTGAKVVTTAAGYGKGTYTYTPSPGSFALVVPATTLRGTGTFTATMTVTINSGP